MGSGAWSCSATGYRESFQLLFSRDTEICEVERFEYRQRDRRPLHHGVVVYTSIQSSDCSIESIQQLTAMLCNELAYAARTLTPHLLFTRLAQIHSLDFRVHLFRRSSHRGFK